MQVLSLGVLLMLGAGFALVFLSEFAFWWLGTPFRSPWVGLVPVALVLAVAALLRGVPPTLLGALVAVALFLGVFPLADAPAALRYASLALAALAGGALAYLRGGRETRSVGRYAAGLGAGAAACGLVFLLASLVFFGTV